MAGILSRPQCVREEIFNKFVSWHYTFLGAYHNNNILVSTGTVMLFQGTFGFIYLKGFSGYFQKRDEYKQMNVCFPLNSIIVYFLTGLEL